MVEIENDLIDKKQKIDTSIKSDLKWNQGKGNINLLIRSFFTFLQALVTLTLILFHDRVSFDLPLILCQCVSSMSLGFQWKYATPEQFIIRAGSNLVKSANLIHFNMYGLCWPAYECSIDKSPWHDERLTFRIINCIAILLYILCAISLICQYFFPHRSFLKRGNE